MITRLQPPLSVTASEVEGGVMPRIGRDGVLSPACFRSRQSRVAARFPVQTDSEIHYPDQ